MRIVEFCNKNEPKKMFILYEIIFYRKQYHIYLNELKIKNVSFAKNRMFVVYDSITEKFFRTPGP